MKRKSASTIDEVPPYRVHVQVGATGNHPEARCVGARPVWGGLVMRISCRRRSALPVDCAPAPRAPIFGARETTSSEGAHASERPDPACRASGCAALTSDDRRGRNAFSACLPPQRSHPKEREANRPSGQPLVNLAGKKSADHGPSIIPLFRHECNLFIFIVLCTGHRSKPKPSPSLVARAAPRAALHHTRPPTHIPTSHRGAPRRA